MAKEPRITDVVKVFAAVVTIRLLANWAEGKELTVGNYLFDPLFLAVQALIAMLILIFLYVKVFVFLFRRSKKK